MDILLQFQGIIGAIVGSIATLITTHALKHKGKLYFHIEHFRLSFQKLDRGEFVIDNGWGQGDQALAELQFDVYNGSSVPKVRRNIRLKFCNKAKEIVTESHLYDNLSGRQKIEVLNVPPQNMAHFDVCSLLKNCVHSLPLTSIQYVYLVTESHKGRLYYEPIPFERINSNCD